MIRLRLLGPHLLEREDGTAVGPVLAQPKHFALLAYLAAAHPPALRRRDTLLGLFWPEADEEHARTALRQALYRLRRSLGPDVLTGQGDELVGIDPGRLWCDAAAFDAALEEGRPAGALELYGGPFLEGFHLSGALEFERWMEREGRRLARRAGEAAWTLAQEAEEEEDRPGARRWGERALELAPYDEEGLRRYLELMHRLGQPAAAIRAYEAYAERLARDLELEPSAETSALIERIRAGGARETPVPSTPSESPQPARPALFATSGPTAEGTEGEATSVPGPRRRLPRLTNVAAAAGLLLLAGAGVRIAAGGAGADLTPHRILVLPLENRTGEPSLESVGTIAADWIVQGLARMDVVDVVPSIQALGLLHGLDEEGRSPDVVARGRALAHAVGAGTVVVGSYHRQRGDLAFQAQVIDVTRDRLIGSVDAVRGPQGDPMRAIDELRRRTVGAVGFQFDARIHPSMRSALRPPSYEAYQAFAAGLEHRQRMQWRPATAYFHEAFALDTSFTPAIFMAALDHLNLREHAQADSLIRILTRSRERLPVLERLLLGWAEAVMRGDLLGSLKAARALDRFSPEQFRPHLVHTALSANRPREALAAHRGIDIDRNPHTPWRLAFARRATDAYHRLGDHRRELREVKRARKRHPELVEPILWEIRALAALGRTRQALDRLEEAMAMPPHTKWPPGEIIVRAADELRAHRHAAESREVLARALAWYRELPAAEAELERHRRYRAAALLRGDSLDAAEGAFRELAAEFREDPYYIASVAVALARRGDRAAASEIAETALDRDPPYDFGHHLYQRARIAAQLGNADEAVGLLRQSFARGFDFAFVGGSRTSTAAARPDAGPHLDPAFDDLRAHPGFRELARGKD